MQHSHRTQEQKRITSLVNNFDLFPIRGQIKIAYLFYNQINLSIQHRNNIAMQNWRF